MSLTDKEIMDGVLAEFSNLATIPRKSNHEETVSNFERTCFIFWLQGSSR